MTKKYLSLEHSIRNAVRDQNYKKKPLNEDFEFEMARNELRTAIDAAKRLMAQLDGEGELEAWVQSKITKGADYLDTVADYMDSRDTKKLKEETEEIMEAIGLVGGVFKGNQFQGGTPEIGPGHTKAALKTSSNRKAVKQEKSMTMHGKVVEEEQLDEYAAALRVVGAGASLLTKTLSKAPTKEVLSKGSEVAKDTIKIKPKPEPEVIAKGPKIEPGKAPEVKPSEPTPVRIEPKPNKPADKVPDTEAPAPKVEPKVEPKTEPKVEPKTETEPLPIKSPDKGKNNKDALTPKIPEKGKLPKIKIPGGYKEPPAHSEFHSVPVKVSVGKASQHRTFKEETGPDNTRRKDSSKELVGRPDSAGVKDSKSVLARNASIKTKIIDEEKKLAGVVKSVIKKKKEEKEGGPNPLVDFEPKLNHKYDNEN